MDKNSLKLMVVLPLFLSLFIANMLVAAQSQPIPYRRLAKPLPGPPGWFPIGDPSDEVWPVYDPAVESPDVVADLVFGLCEAPRERCEQDRSYCILSKDATTCFCTSDEEGFECEYK